MKFLILSFFIIVFSLNAKAQCYNDSINVVIENITVIPMTDTLTVLSNKTVLIQNNTITQI
ncbi:MAG: hypothetical protein ACK5W1_04980, partial [Flavobacteriales bacterium]